MTSSQCKLFAGLLLALTVLTGAQAQESPPEPDQPSRRRALPVPDMDVGEGNSQFQPKIEGDKVTGLQTDGVNVKTVLRFYQDLTGKTVVADPSVQGAVTIDAVKPMTKKAAEKLLELTLTTSNFSLVLRDDLLLVLGPGKPTRSAAVPIYYDEKSIPGGVSIISYLFVFKHLDPNEMANMLNQYLATGQPYTNFLPMPGSRALLVTETTESVRNLIPLIKKLDVPAGGNAPDGKVD